MPLINLERVLVKSTAACMYRGNEILGASNLRSGSIFVSLGETFRREGRNEK